ncbi:MULTISPECIES: hypothetical protein [unclassified Luteococcus]|uniref:hypothetical protein n=1 Tax=unclassified Luteococcus TaxID=2639923 RepID=UPI00313B06A2
MDGDARVGARQLLAPGLSALGLAVLVGCAQTPPSPPQQDSDAPVVVTTAPSTAAPSTASATGPRPTPVPVPTSGSTAPSSAASVTRAPASVGPADASALAASFGKLQASLSGPAGIAVVPVGGRGEAVHWGKSDTGPAWSTAKVPLSIAALSSPGPDTQALVRRAITASDNEAADQLWHQLGAGKKAAAAVDRVLRAGGDPVTRTQPAAVRPPYSAFGQTPWALGDQARFAAQLPCQDGASQVLGLMRQVDAGQAWGLHRLEGAAIKGGWGPSSGAGYLVRQLAVLPVDGGQLGVAVMVDSPAGFEAGVRDLDAIAGWVREHRAELPAGGNC